jgi:hypothetical protein
VQTRAWPYAVTRGKESGYQAILVPDFLADAGLTYVLEYASREETAEPDVAIVREVRNITYKPLSLVYRVMEARAYRYDLGGDDLLEDHAGRTIRVFEGLTLPVTAAHVASFGLTVYDMDMVSGMTVPAFRKLWVADTRIDPERSAPIAVGDAAVGIPALNLRIAEPYVVPGDDPPRVIKNLERARAMIREVLPGKHSHSSGPGIIRQQDPGPNEPDLLRSSLSSPLPGPG